MTFLSLELQAVDSFVYVHRAGETSALVLAPVSTVTRVCCLGNSDVIRFSSTNTSITVSVPPDNVQVGSSLPAEAKLHADSGTPKPSTSLDKVVETPTARRVETPHSSTGSLQFSTAKMARHAQNDENKVSLHFEGKVTNEINDSRSGLDEDPQHDAPMVHFNKPSPSDERNDEDDPTESEDDNNNDRESPPSIKTNVTQTTKKRGVVDDGEEEESMTPRPSKKARSESLPPITSMDEEFGPDESVKRKKRGRGRPKKDSSEGVAITPKPQQQNHSVVIQPNKAKNPDSPSSTATSTIALAKKDASSFQSSKPVVVFSGSGFEDLPQLVKSFKSLATVAESVAKKTDILWYV
jgi:hypothetical protein